MTARHLVARQIIEIGAASRGEAEALIDRTSRAAPALAAAIERVLDGLATGAARVRLDRVVIDIGAGDPARWEAHVVAGTAQALGPAITRAEAAHGSDTATALELLAVFAGTGHLPWWASVTDTPAAAIAALAAAGGTTMSADGDGGGAAGTIETGVRALLAAPGAIARLARQLDDASLAVLARLVAPDLPASLAGAAAALAGGPGADPARRAAAWRAILATIAAGEAASAAPPAPGTGAGIGAVPGADLGRAGPAAGGGDGFWRAVGVRLALDPGAPPPRDRAGGARDIGPAPPPAPGRLAVEVGPGRLAATAAGDAAGRSIGDRATATAAPGEAPVAALAARLAARAARGGPWHALLARLAAVAEALDPTIASAALALTGGGPLSPAALSALIRHFASGGALTAAEAAARLADLAAASAAPAVAPPVADADPHDSLVVASAGLALLWPFVPALFRNTGLIGGDGGFPLAARHRAAALLDHLATAARDADETRLMLPKLLAGLDLDAVHEPDAPIADADAAACDALLDAVVAQAPAFKKPGRDGVRALFLARPGLLATRDGHWLLRVERLPQDVLLDRLPWPLGWVRLPWMAQPLQVEW